MTGTVPRSWRRYGIQGFQCTKHGLQLRLETSEVLDGRRITILHDRANVTYVTVSVRLIRVTFAACDSMTDLDCVTFLQWCLPRLGYRWPGFRKVRAQVCKRISRRMAELSLPDTNHYRTYLETHSDEWTHLDRCCRVTISRFYRDRAVFDSLRDEFLPSLARQVAKSGRSSVRCWSAGCASGEEPYTLQMLWQLAVGPSTGLDIQLQISATDIDSYLLDRAKKAVYPSSSLQGLPDDLVATAFEYSGSDRVLTSPFRRNVRWLNQDIRTDSPAGPFDLVLCRNLAFTYFDPSVQTKVIDRIRSVTRPNGLVVIGSHEGLPPGSEIQFGELVPCIYERTS